MRQKHHKIPSLMICLLGLLAVCAPANAQLAGHRVSYEMRLVSADPDTKLAAVRGRTAFQLQQECSGWSSLEEYLLRFQYNEGDEIMMSSHFESWEQTDGQLYSFEVLENSSYEEESHFDGFVHLLAKGGSPSPAAKAIFNGDKTAELALPDGVMFPIAHTSALLEAARQGRKILSALVFVGSEPDQAVRQTNAVIGDRKPNPDPRRAGSVGQAFYWPVQVAYFDPQAEQPEPDYEIRFHLQENGLVIYYEVDYGDFILQAEMNKASGLDQPVC